ncbi:uncharacterized protein MYCFIDRAFT_173918 [Pseudocercospora fijiensis CIRAD86]|uniref:Uncharacterized protein n=1 Tax=Pseudocercospora fijiensis (strain CIRAD86) TaxID=383855 RepID=M3B6T3_PSEFD|nr:uncharacterized protein MYCFIDRAFT_173918 [Pseudocercospora fijiensis CIRAD86]EME85048.1 hypothetical protein MYCFIDRAFT_173918 [Pseudocercospora fijiensis CIRAD86]
MATKYLAIQTTSLFCRGKLGLFSSVPRSLQSASNVHRYLLFILLTRRKTLTTSTMDIAPPRRYTSPSPWTPPSQQKVRSSTSGNIRNDDIPSSPTQLLAPTQLKRISEASELTDTSQEALNNPRPHSASRLSKRFSWVPGWSFAGEKRQSNPPTPSSPDDNADNNDPESPTDSVITSSRRESVAQRLTRRFSSIGESWLFHPEPSHETNFPPSVTFPSSPGKPLCLSVFGTIDSLDGTVIKLQIPIGICQADLAGQKEYRPVLEYMGPRLKNGDLLVRPFMARFSRDPNVAMVVRGAMQEYVFKCHIVGVFPMRVFGEVLPVPYAMDGGRGECGDFCELDIQAGNVNSIMT